MDSAVFFEIFDHDGVWFGTGTIEAAKRAGLIADLSYPLHGRASWATNGWACVAKR